jgi:hypothetical protein
MLGKAFDRFLGAKDLDWNFAKHIFKKKHGGIPSQTLRASSSSYQLQSTCARFFLEGQMAS